MDWWVLLGIALVVWGLVSLAVELLISRMIDIGDEELEVPLGARRLP